MKVVLVSLLVVIVCCDALRVPLRMSQSTYRSSRDLIDFRTDTITMPSESMRKAIAEANVGNDKYGGDPTVSLLEMRMAKIFEKEAAVFMPTETMANLAAAMSWCGTRGSEILLGDKSRMFLLSQGGISQIGGIQQRSLPNKRDGTIALDVLAEAIRGDDNPEFLPTELVTIENTHSVCGGRVLPDGYTESLKLICKKNDIPIHLDGTRIWNAAVALDQPLSYITSHCDSVTASLSKGLGAPAGSLLIGPKDFVDKARRIRKVLGGNMGQGAGILAAAGLHALDEFEEGISTRGCHLFLDHSKARVLAEALGELPGLSVDLDSVQTNIVLAYIDDDAPSSASRIIELLKDNGVLVSEQGNGVRLVLHKDISNDAVVATIETFRHVMRSIWVPPSANDEIVVEEDDLDMIIQEDDQTVAMDEMDDDDKNEELISYEVEIEHSEYNDISGEKFIGEAGAVGDIINETDDSEDVLEGEYESADDDDDDDDDDENDNDDEKSRKHFDSSDLMSQMMDDGFDNEGVESIKGVSEIDDYILLEKDDKMDMEREFIEQEKYGVPTVLQDEVLDSGKGSVGSELLKDRNFVRVPDVTPELSIMPKKVESGTGSINNEVSEPPFKCSFFEETSVFGMSVTEDGFCVFLRGLVCDRFLKVLVTPSDPMADGLDREQVETPEAVTLLQLLQGIDVESHLSKSALNKKFEDALALKKKDENENQGEMEDCDEEEDDGNDDGNDEDSIQMNSDDEEADESDDDPKFLLRRVLVRNSRGKDFDAILYGEIKGEPLHSHSNLDAVQVTTLNDTYDLQEEEEEELDTSEDFPDDDDDGNTRYLGPSKDFEDVDDPTFSNSAAANSDPYGSSLPILSPSSFGNHLLSIQVESSFEAIALALRHGAVVEVSSPLLQDSELSFTLEEMKSQYPKLLESGVSTIESRFSEDYDNRHEMERLQRQLFEALRQENTVKIDAIKRQLEFYSNLGGTSVLLPPRSSK